MTRNTVRKSAAKQEYFHWLCDLIHAEGGSASYILLAKDLHSIPFTWTIPNDDNRAGDGLVLRERYEVKNPFANVQGLDMGACSVLEMLIALAGRMDFELSDPNSDKDYTVKCFWEMIDNLGLMPYSDDVYVSIGGPFNVDTIVTSFLKREYNDDGDGGLFPLKRPSTNQREVEIWYQMQKYLEENY
jgi:hypothetical protein